MMKTSSSLWLHLLFVLIYSLRCIHCGIRNLPGETQPPRVEISINGSANVTCRMNLTTFGGNVNSSSLYFVEEDTGKRVLPTDIEVLNETTIVFMLRNASEQDRNYVCKSGVMGIGVTHVSVGTAPLDVTDFKCRGYDYTYMVCTFSIPHNVILTHYSLSYTAQSANYIQLCPLEVQWNQAICNLTLDQNNYRATYEFFNFTLTGRNDVGTNTQSFWINNYESVIPPRPEYTFEKITNNSVVIKWSNIKYSFYTAKGLQYEIRLRPKNIGMGWTNHSNYEIRNNRSEYKLIVRNIPFAYVWYELSVRVRVKKAARNDESYWSEPYIQEFQTAACPPAAAPLTDVGSFYIDPSETKLRLYWHQLPDYMKNGPKFQYVIKQIKIDDAVVSMEPIHIDLTSAVFPWHRRHRYEFVLKSQNAEGESPNNSTIKVPSWSKHNKSLTSPEWIRNVYNDTTRIYTLSWRPPARQDDLVDYTVFWCQSKTATPSDCEDTVYFVHVDKNTTVFNTPPQKQDQKPINLAVSANYVKFSSGMHWTMCAAAETSDLAKMNPPEVISIFARSITIQWRSERVCSSLLEGYNITYCRIHHQHGSNAENSSCLEDPQTITVPSMDKKYTIKELKPFSTYKIEMLMFSKLHPGIMSDPRIVNTKEEAPSKPLHLEAQNITSNSAVLTWLSPEHRNGILRKYRIEYNNEHHIIDCLADGTLCSHKQMTFTLENLSSYTNYKVYVVAYTTEASEHSNDINVYTLVGIPSNPRYIKTKEKSHNILQWSEPEVPSGRVEFYQVVIMVWYKDLVQRQRISNVVGSHECRFQLPVCMDADYRFTIQVRAVNVAERESKKDNNTLAARNLISSEDVVVSHAKSIYMENDDLKCEGTAKDAKKQLELIEKYSDVHKYVQYKSVWETGPVTHCSNTKLSQITTLALLVVVSSLGVMAAFYVAHNKYKKMANISCALPPGLEAMTYPTKDNGGDFRRSKESFYNNESRHLLSSISHDSGYICHNADHHNADGIDGIPSGSLGKSSGYMGSDHSTTDVVSGHGNGCIVDQTPIVDDAYMVMELLKPSKTILETSPSDRTFDDHLLYQSDQSGYVQPSLSAIAAFNKTTQIPTSFLPTENGYIKQIPASNDVPHHQVTPRMIPSENGYIKPHNILNWSTQKFPPTTTTSSTIQALPTMGDLAINGSGYVAPQMLQKPSLQPPAPGYTSLETLSKSVDHTHLPISQGFTSPEGGGGGGGHTNLLPPISGYVTQKELSAFGQQQQFN